MASSLTIGRMCNVYRVAADDPAPDEVRSRLDRLAVDEVVHACQSRLADFIDDDDASIWLIRSLEVDLAVDASAHSTQRTGFAWGEQLALEISRTLERGPGESVVRFPNRAAFVAQWVRDMAAGHAWGKWYYADFNSLRSLSQSAAIAEGILRESDARGIVLHLHREGALETVLDILTSYDADRLYRSLVSGSGHKGAQWSSRLLALWNSVLNVRTRAGDQLRLWAAASTEWSEDGTDASLPDAIDNLLELRSVLAQTGSAELSSQFMAEAMTGDLSSTRSLLADRHIQLNDSLLNFIRTESRGNPDWANFAATTVSSPSKEDPDESFLSELGGVFLLASAFQDLQIDNAMLAAAAPSDDPPRYVAILRFLLAVRCLGAGRAASAIHDRAVMEFAALPGAVTLDEMAHALRESNAQSALAIVNDAVRELYGHDFNEESYRDLNYFKIGSVFPDLKLEAEDEAAWSRIAATILGTFARRLPGFARSSPEYLYRNFIVGTAQLRVGKSAIEVSMGKCPLGVVLKIAGAYRTLALPWREGVEICLLKPPD